MIMDTNNQRFKFYILEKNKNHYCLFGIDKEKNTCYLHDAIEFEEKSTLRYTIESARRVWAKLLKEEFKQVQLTDNKYFPHFLNKKIQQWSKFTETSLKKISGIESSDPWMINDKKSEKQNVNKYNSEKVNYSIPWDIKDPFEIDWDNLGFEALPTRSMWRDECKTGELWNAGELVPYGEISLSPASCVLNYGQGLFEGMKAFHSAKNRIVMFRPDKNSKRIQKTQERMCVPIMSSEYFLNAVYSTVKDNLDYIPPFGKGSMYIRPVCFGTSKAILPSIWFL